MNENVVVEFAHEHENTIWRYQLVRTYVSATNCTSGRKYSNRLDVIVCDVSYDGRRCYYYYSVIIRMVHKYHSFISISFIQSGNEIPSPAQR